MANLNIKTALTGGTVNCVDRNSAGMKIDGSVCFALIDGSPNVLRAYKFDAASTAIANGNTVIIPYGQSGGTAGRWLQHGIMIGSLTPELLGYIGNLTSDAQAQLNEIGRYRGVLSSSAATVTLTAEHRGYLIILYSGSAQTVYLPQEAALPIGWAVTILKETLGGTALIDPYYGQIDSGNGLVSSLTVGGMEDVSLTWDGALWRLGGSVRRAVFEAGQTWQDVSVANGTVYSNTTTKVEWYSVTFRRGAGGGVISANVYCDGVPIFSWAVDSESGQDPMNTAIFPVSPGSSWYVSCPYIITARKLKS